MFVRVSAPKAGRSADAADVSTERLAEATGGLARIYPGLSARDRVTYPQQLILAMLFGMLAMNLWLAPIKTLYILGSLLNLVFIWAILFRAYAFFVVPRSPQARADMDVLHADENVLPVYSILVPLLREERVVADLIEHLKKLDYPCSRLDIKLICEQDDVATLNAARACDLPPCFSFVVLPPSLPRTKPKALNYALQEVRGDFVVVYDAEDRPDLDQLRKAVGRFAGADEHILCLQARLNFYNPDHNWLTRQFTIEYSALFDAVLLALQRLRLPIPLGGTSNHFRTAGLRRVGGWDAYNVTEDADLGIRMYRFGYSCQMLGSTTHEEACARLGGWIRQRTRWLKGWLQTWFVHMRHPITLYRQLGGRGFWGFQLVLGVQILALLAHPAFIAFLLFEANSGRLFVGNEGLAGSFLLWLAGFNLVFGYLTAIALAMRSLRRRRIRLLWHTLMMPFYWLLISVATFRALLHFFIKPFHWEKTEHGLGAAGEARVDEVAVIQKARQA